MSYLHSDHLGSTVLTTGVSGSRKYHAYGSARSGSVPTDIQFTGQMTSPVGLVYMHARYYDPVTGIFISPDTIIPDSSNLFDYNRYMYARGNPLTYSDPTGHVTELEACRYFGACTYEEFKAKYGESLTTLLWDTSVTWGDKIEWGIGEQRTNVAMLILMDYGDGTHQADLWGIEGQHEGTFTGLARISQQPNMTFDTTSVRNDVQDVYDLPIRTALLGSYYPTKYVDIGELWMVSAAATAYSLVGAYLGVSTSSTAWAAEATTTGTGIADQAKDLTGSLADWVDETWAEGPAEHLDQYYTGTLNPWHTYPVIRYAPLYGSGGLTFHLLGPGGR